MGKGFIFKIYFFMDVSIYDKDRTITKEKKMEKIRIGKIFEFDAAHELPYHQGKCKNLHGHRYRLLIEIEGTINKLKTSPEYGMVMDYGKLKEIVEEFIIDRMDHSYLNDLFPNPTAENMVVWIATVIGTQIPKDLKLTKVVLWETSTSYAEWRKE